MGASQLLSKTKSRGMAKLVVRLFVVFTAVYFVQTYIMAWIGEECFSDAYIVFAEVAICIVMSSQGKYHCKYLKHTAYGLTASDCITRIDNAFDILSVEVSIILPLSIVMCSVVISFVLALRHYYRVLKLKSKHHEIQ